jgi:hypothetical protein
MILSQEVPVKEMSGLRRQQGSLLLRGVFPQQQETKQPENFMPDNHSL